MFCVAQTVREYFDSLRKEPFPLRSFSYSQEPPYSYIGIVFWLLFCEHRRRGLDSASFSHR